MSGNVRPNPSNMTSTTTPDNDDGGASAISLSTDTDTAYCTELARRSVARAALHLGIEGMETSALDVLGSVLLGYLSNVGSDIATNVEGSGRSSAHVNAYDVLNAVEGCTALAATQLRFAAASQQGPQNATAAAAILPMQQLQNSNSQQQQPYSSSALLPPGETLGNNNNNNSRGWEGLAYFLFGPNWYSIPLEGEDINKQKKDDKKKPLSSTTTAVTGMATATVVTSNIKDGTILNGNNNNIMNGKSTANTATATTGKTLPEGNSNNSTTIPRPQETGKGKGKQLANMTPPSGKKIATPPAAGGDATTSTADDEKNVSFSLERKNSKGDTIMMSTGGGGGEGNNLINSIVNDTRTSTSSTPGGRWDAPYPQEVLPFPLVTHTNPTEIANPHCLSGTNISLSMHDLAMEPEACRGDTHHHFEKKQRRSSSGSISGTTTDYKKELAAYKLNKSMERDGKISRDVFSTKNIIWGSIPGGGVGAKGGNSNVNAKSDDDNKKSSAPGGGGVGRGPLPKLSQAKMPSYVPNFFPPYPRMEDSSISSSLPSVPTTTIMSDVMSRVSQKRKKPSSSSSSSSSNNNVRSSLVALGKKNTVGSSYWGSNWLDNETHDGRKEKLKSNNTAGQLTVMAGPSSSAASGRMASSSSDANNKKTGGGTTDAQVVPLTRASGSRVAKILEGSN